ncbi:MAG: MFS transporter [Betaproteobacteria bacterium]|nr:MFS transporter [Betaproteobacteria bacterium]
MVGRPDWLTRQVAAWAFYDVASSTFAGLVPVFFGLFFVTVVAADRPGAQGQWGMIAALALLVAGALAPLYGALADRRERLPGLLAGATALCVAATLAMPLADRGKMLLAGILFVAAQVGYTLAAALYDSLLVRIAPRTHVGRVSGFGWTVGFTGGIGALLMALWVMRGVPPEVQAARLGLTFAIAGILYAAFAVPALLGLRRCHPVATALEAGRGGGAYAAVIGTLRQWRRHREVFRFLIGYYLLNDVLVTVLFFIAIILQARFGLTIEGLLWLVLLYHAIALPATLAFGHAADGWGQRPAIFVMIGILGTALLLLAFGRNTATPVAVVALLGLVYGSLQAVCRSLFALLVAQEKSGEMFGFNAVAGRLSAALGPLAFGAVSAATQSETVALVSLLIFLAAASALFRSLRVPARSHEVDAPELL